MINKIIGEQGASLTMVLGLALLLSMAVISSTTWIGRDGEIKTMAVHNSQAFYAAEAGIERVLWSLVQDYYWQQSQVAGELVNGQRYTTQVTIIHRIQPPPLNLDELEEQPPGELKVTVSSLGSYGSARERIRATYHFIYYEEQVTTKVEHWSRIYP